MTLFGQLKLINFEKHYQLTSANFDTTKKALLIDWLSDSPSQLIPEETFLVFHNITINQKKQNQKQFPTKKRDVPLRGPYIQICKQC